MKRDSNLDGLARPGAGSEEGLQPQTDSHAQKQGGEEVAALGALEAAWGSKPPVPPSPVKNAVPVPHAFCFVIV